MLKVGKYLHSISLAHKDLKPENIILGETGIYKVIDFGSAKTQEKEFTVKSPTKKGTTDLYWAPEFYNSNTDETNNEFTRFKYDTYALGLVFLEVLGSKIENIKEMKRLQSPEKKLEYK